MPQLKLMFIEESSNLRHVLNVLKKIMFLHFDNFVLCFIFRENIADVRFDK